MTTDKTIQFPDGGKHGGQILQCECGSQEFIVCRNGDVICAKCNLVQGVRVFVPEEL